MNKKIILRQKQKSRFRLKLLLILFTLLVIILALFTIYISNSNNSLETKGMGSSLISNKQVLIPNTSTTIPLLPLILCLLVVMIIVTALLIVKQKTIEVNENKEYNRLVSENKLKIKDDSIVSPNEFNLRGRRV